MVRKAVGENVAAHPFAFEIDLSHQVDRSLLVDMKPGLAPGHLDLARPQHNLNRGGGKNRIGCAHVFQSFVNSDCRMQNSRTNEALPQTVKHVVMSVDRRSRAEAGPR